MPSCDGCGQWFSPSFDEQRYCWNCWREFPGITGRLRRRSSQAARDEHDDYLDSVDWRLQRAFRIQLAAHQCEQCAAGTALQAHHQTYERTGSELLEDLEVLCRDCHEAEHDITPTERTVKLPANVKALAASPATATVELRTLTVGGKGMTIATFRQLPERRLITPERELAGEPWGTVNVCPSRDCPYRDYDGQEHRHVIWSADGRLYRDVCSQPGRFQPWSEYGEDWATLAVTLPAMRDRLTWHRKDGSRYCRIEFVEGLPPVDCDLKQGAWADHPVEPPECSRDAGYGEWCDGDQHTRWCELGHWRKTQAEIEAAAADVLKRLKVTSIDQLSALIREELHDDHARWCDHLAVWGRITALPQLFLGLR